MRQTIAIFKREMQAYFASPIAYAVIAVFLVVAGVGFDGVIAQFLQLEAFVQQQAAFGRQMPALNLNEIVVRSYFSFIVAFVPVFLTPVITMRLFAEEKKQGTMELLMTSPVTDVQIVLGKYLAALALFTTLLIASLLHVGFLYLYGRPDTGPILVGYLGLFLVGATYVSIGLFVSSLTENQIVAAVGTIAVSLLLFMIGFSSELLGETLGGVIEYMSVSGHLQDFEKGVVDTRDLVYFGSLTVFALFLTLRSVESLRWRG